MGNLNTPVSQAWNRGGFANIGMFRAKEISADLAYLLSGRLMYRDVSFGVFSRSLKTRAEQIVIYLVVFPGRKYTPNIMITYKNV